MIDSRIRLLSFITGIFLFSASFFVFAVFSQPRNFPKGHIISIEDGTSLRQIAQKLKKENVINYPRVFRWFVEYAFGGKSIKAGDYFFEQPLSIFTLSGRLAKGEYDLVPVKITIPEGATLRDIGFIFENLGMFMAEELWEAAGFPAVDYREAGEMAWPKDFSSITPLLADKPAYVGLEGYLFPDTYFFPPNITPEGVVIAALKNLDSKITPELRQEILDSGHGVFEILTMASLIEREAPRAEDRRLISGVLWKRLGKEVPLQVDAPFVYIIAKNTFQLTKEDLKMDSLYNTYRYKGLPFGPIANPGLDAIKAALEPEESPYWYYLSDREGNVYFSKTFEEHRWKKEKYLK